MGRPPSAHAARYLNTNPQPLYRQTFFTFTTSTGAAILDHRRATPSPLGPMVCLHPVAVHRPAFAERRRFVAARGGSDPTTDRYRRALPSQARHRDDTLRHRLQTGLGDTLDRAHGCQVLQDAHSPAPRPPSGRDRPPPSKINHPVVTYRQPPSKNRPPSGAFSVAATEERPLSGHAWKPRAREATTQWSLFGLPTLYATTEWSLAARLPEV